jgi:hypothetical protein
MTRKTQESSFVCDPLSFFSHFAVLAHNVTMAILVNQDDNSRSLRLLSLSNILLLAGSSCELF